MRVWVSYKKKEAQPEGREKKEKERTAREDFWGRREQERGGR